MPIFDDPLPLLEQEPKAGFGKCKFCGKWVGIFKHEHPECAEEHARLKQQRIEEENQTTAMAKEAKTLMASAPAGAVSVEELTSLLDPIADGKNEVLWRAFCAWIGDLVGGNQPPTAAEESLAGALLNHYKFEREKIPNAGWNKLVRFCAMRDLDEGKIPQRCVVERSPFNLEAGEVIVWAFPDTQYMEDKVVRSSMRGYAGMSVRVAPGVYLHGGNSSPASISEGYIPVDAGLLALTDRAVLFRGSHKAIRFKYKDIATFTRYDYGFAICKGTQTARNIGFETKDVFAGFPDFLLRALARLHMESKANLPKRSRSSKPANETL